MQTKPTLLVTASTFPRWEGDSEPRFVYDLSKRLCSTFNVIVLAPHAAGAATEEHWDGLHIYRYRYAPEKLEKLAYEGGLTANLKERSWRYLLLPSFFLGQWLTLRKLLKTHHIDAIHAHWLIPQGLIAAFAIYWNKQAPPLLCTSHGGDIFGLQDKISIYLKQWAISRCQAITVVSNSLVKYTKVLDKANSIPIHVLPMGTDLMQTFVPNLKITRHPNQLLFVGRLVEKKGVQNLLYALKEIIKNLPDTHLIIAGSGPLQNDLLALVAELKLCSQVIFTGRLRHIDLVKLYQESTLAVFPFVQAKDGDMEGLGLVMIEAIGCGCPVLASDLPAVRDVIQHEKTGYLVPPNNQEALTKEIIRLLKNQTNLSKVTENSIELIRKKFDWQMISNAYSNTIIRLKNKSFTN